MWVQRFSHILQCYIGILVFRVSILGHCFPHPDLELEASELSSSGLCSSEGPELVITVGVAFEGGTSMASSDGFVTSAFVYF